MGKHASGRRYSRFAPQVLSFFAQHRLALADHVQRYLADLLPSDRTARMHLQTLVAAGDLTITREPGIGRPNVYRITPHGMRAASVEDESAPEDKRWRRYSAAHTSHELLITEFAVSLAEATRERPEISLQWAERFQLAGRDAFRGLVPDYAFLFSQPAGRLVCLVEVSCGEESITRLRDKLHRYARWAESETGKEFLVDRYRQYGAEKPRPQFRLLFVVQNRRSGNDATRLRQIFGEVLKLPPSMRRRIWGTTVGELAAARGVDAPVWIRGQDLESCLSRWESLPQRNRKQLLNSVMRDAPRHRLLGER